LSNLESAIGMVVPKDYYEKAGKDGFANRPVGSGPYKWHSQMAGSFIKLEATDKHWRDGVPKYKYMTYLVIPEESTRMAMLMAGEADISRISRGALKDALSSGLNVLTKQNASVIVFQANMQWTSPVFSDIRFRKAINLAIDKEAIIKHIFSGMADPIAAYPGSNISTVGGDLTLKPYPYDPQEARRLIKEGGWEGHEFTLLSYPRPGFPELSLVVETLAGYWQQIGLKPKIRASEWAIWRRAWSERKTQNTIHGYDGSQSRDVSQILNQMVEKWYFKNGRSAVNIPEVNERFDRIEKSMDVAEISRLIAELYRYAYDNYLMIPICEIPIKLTTSKRVPPWDTGLRRFDNNYYDLIKQQ
jgi:peptide/nickel transport system substrate-binding protein